MKHVTQKCSNIEIGTTMNGWTCVKKYRRFYLWEKKVANTVIKECCFEGECPKKESLL